MNSETDDDVPEEMMHRNLDRWAQDAKNPWPIRSNHGMACPCLGCADVRGLMNADPVTPDFALYVLDPERARPYRPYGDDDDGS